VANGVFNIAKGAIAEKFRDGAPNGIVMLLTANQAETGLVDQDTLATLLAGGNTESVATNYARKTGITGTVTVDDSNDRVDVDMPDQTWLTLGPGTAIVKAVVAYQESAADAGRIPLTHHDFAISPDGSDVTLQFNAAGFARMS
jgi:allantoicase